MKPKCFYAYPSQPSSLVETIEVAIEKINKNDVVDMRSWKASKVTGKFIINEICKAIDESTVFACDLTYLNPNVLFELGYAIAKKKKVWITLDKGIETARKNYDKLRLLTTVGFTTYTNAENLVKAFYEEEPFNDLENTIYNNSIQYLIQTTDKSKLVYLKSTIDTEASVRLTNRIKESPLDKIIDDPAEISTQPLSWYVQNVASGTALICHYLSESQRDNELHNAKLSLISGLALGFSVPLLMLAHDPYVSPIDYRDLLKIHNTARECQNIAHDWLLKLEVEYVNNNKRGAAYAKKVRAKNRLQQLYIGDYIAENEAEELIEYFVETSVYTEALKAKQSLIVGRKGTGKSANLYKISDELEKDKRNHVCVIKPISYELEGILYMLKQSMPLSEKGYLVESFWKFLIYTELAKSVYDKIVMRHDYLLKSLEEQELFEFVYENQDIITSDFSIRLQNAVSKLCGLGDIQSIEVQRAKISEMLHLKIISKLRVLLGQVLTSKNKVCILIDNLDKAWNRRDDLNSLSELLYGLLSVSKRIAEDFTSADALKRKVNLSLIIFLRSDIFNFIVSNARERDKIPFNKIVWNNEMLLRIIEERIFFATDVEPEVLWERFFCNSVKGIPVKSYIANCIIPRPRDIVYFCKAALCEAINKGHDKVEEQDILAAEKKYSQYVLDTIIVENGVTIDEIESILYEFVGLDDIITEEELKNLFTKAGLSEHKIEVAIGHLCELAFLGIEVKTNIFEYLYDDKDRKIIEGLANKLSQVNVRRYHINRPFHSYLEIISSTMVSKEQIIMNFPTS